MDLLLWTCLILGEVAGDGTEVTLVVTVPDKLAWMPGV